MPTSDQLAREAKASRERLSRTLDELRTRLAPDSLVEEATTYLRRASEEPLIAEAPPAGRSRYALPLAVIGAGLTWLALEARRSKHVPDHPERLPADLATMDEALAVTGMAGKAAREDAIQPIPTATIEPQRLATVEGVSITPPSSSDERQDQRSLPL